MQSSVEQLVKSLIAHHVGRRCEQVELTQSLRRDLGFDNLSLVGIALELEDERHAEFPFECLENIDTVSDLVALTSSLAAPIRHTPLTSAAPRRQLGSLRRVSH